MERREFVAEGKMEIGPSAQFFVFLDGDYLGQQLINKFRFPEERGYTDLGRVRVTVEQLEEGEG